MLKLPKGLKKKKKKSKKDQELFTEEELEQYKRELKAKQEAAAAKSDAGESDAPSDVENSSATLTTTLTTITTTTATTTTTGNTTAVSSTTATASGSVAATTSETAESVAHAGGKDSKAEVDEEWAKFKALTSGVDSILHKTQDELDRIKKESFYQRLPSAAEKKRLEEEEAARREAERLEEERRKAAELEAKRDKLAEAVVVLSESEEEDDVEVDDIFATDYIEKITSGEVQLAVVPDSPVLEIDEGPDPFDTAYAEKVIVGADKAKGNKKLVSLGAAVEVLSGRVDREHALALAKPKRKLRKGIKDLLLSESVDLADVEAVEEPTSEPVKNLLDELAEDVPEPDVPIDLSVSLHLNFIQPKSTEDRGEDKDGEEEFGEKLDLSEFDTLKSDEDDEFAELAVESLSKKEEVKVISQIALPQPEVFSEVAEGDWAEFEQIPEEESKVKPKRPPPPRPSSGPHTIPGAIFISDDEDDNLDDDPFNTAYADQVIKKTTVLEEDEEFDPRAEEKKLTGPPVKPPPPAAHLLASREEFIDPFDTSAVEEIVKPNTTKSFNGKSLTNSLSDPDFNPRADEPATTAQITENPVFDFDTAQRKSSLNLNIQSKTVGFLVPDQNLLSLTNDSVKVQKPLTPFYAAPPASVVEQVRDPFDTTYVPVSRPTEVELKNLEKSLLENKTTLEKSLSDPDFDPRADEISAAQDLLAVQENINIKVLTPATETKEIGKEPETFDPFDTSSIAANIQPGKAELKLLESELLPATTPEIKTGVLDTQTDAQELGLGDKVLTPLAPRKQVTLPEDIDPFDTSIAENLAPGAVEIKLLESELIEH